MDDTLVLNFDMDISSAEAKMKRMEREFEREKAEMARINAERAEQQRILDENLKREKQINNIIADRKITAKTRRDGDTEKASQMWAMGKQHYGDDWTKTKSALESERATALQKIEQAEMNINNLEAQRERTAGRVTQKYEQTLSAQERVRKETEKVNIAQSQMPVALQSAGKSLGAFTNRVKGLIKRVFIFSLITMALRKLRKAIGELMGKDSELATYVNQIKGNLSVMGRTIFETLKPVIKWLLEKLSQLTYMMAVILAKVLNKDVKQMAKMAKESKKTAKNAERTAFAFDTIQKVDKKDEEKGGADFSQFDGAKYTEEQLAKIMAVAGVALLAVGLILVFTGAGIPLGLGAMVAGVKLIVTAVKMSTKMTDDVRAFIGKIMAIAGGALLVLGIIMCFVPGQLPLAIGAIVAGVALIVTAVALNKDALKEKVKKFFDEHQALIGGFKVVLGIILCVTGIGLLLGVTLMKSGLEQMAKADPAKYGFLEDTIIPVLDKIKTALKGAFLVVLGVLLAVTGIGLPLGVNLIKQGIATLVTINNPDKKDDVLAWLDEKLNALKERIYNFFNGLPDGVKIFVNGIIKGLNWLIEKANKLIQGLNGISFGDWSPNLPYINYLPYLEVPKLAKGAVIAGGSPFLAMLGDQPKGQTNIEAPLETIMDAVRGVIGEQQFSINFEGSLAQLARILNPQIKKEQRRSSIW